MRRSDALALLPSGNGLARTGLRPDGGGAVSINSGTMGVTVQPFTAWVSAASAAQGGYPVVLDAAKVLAVSPGHATLARVDTVVAQVRDTASDGSGFTDMRVLIVEGTPGAGQPALPATTIALRNINVPAGASTGTGGLVAGNLGTDRRVYTSALGGIVPVATATERDALGAQLGQVVYRTDLDLLEVKVGTPAGWRAIASSEHSQVVSTAALTTSGTSADVPGLTKSFVSAGTSGIYVVSVSLDVERIATATAGNIFVGTVVMDGAAAAAQMVYQAPGINSRCTVTKEYVFTGLSAGNHTVKVQGAGTASTGDYRVNSPHSSFTFHRTA
ncbi:hypothetical protein ACJ5H2_13615 [Nocardioides sp. R1-1]|uniref:hypothetical protein n=1 Tax=Nocardioides sp. R1-1 TaxID=3383502 RepID=UPI0038D13351